MKKRKSEESKRDHLTELPEPLIFHIFWFMPLRDVVRTTILSKHWNKLWTTTPCLNIQYYGNHNRHGDLNAIRSFVNRALVLWEGMNIQKFKVKFRSLIAKPFFTDFDCWVHFAMGKKVQELYLHFDGEEDEFEEYLVPQSLYSCPSLKVLPLTGCRIEITRNVQLNQLKSFKIKGCHITASAINQFLCGSPQLEVFVLAPFRTIESWSIRSCSLRKLWINNVLYDYGLAEHTELRIWTPNLESLKISGVPFGKCLLMDVSSLSQASLGFGGLYLIDDDDSSYKNVILEKTLTQIIPPILHVEKVELSDWCIQVLGRMKLKNLLPSSSSSNAKYLKLNNWCVPSKNIVGVLAIFPKLEMLVFKGTKCQYRNIMERLELNAYVPESFLKHPRTVEITWVKDDELMSPLIELVLRFARKLEKMVVRGGAPSPSSASLLLASQQLLRMLRSSPNSGLIFV